MFDRAISLATIAISVTWLLGLVLIAIDLVVAEARLGSLGLFFGLIAGSSTIRRDLDCRYREARNAFELGRESIRRVP